MRDLAADLLGVSREAVNGSGRCVLQRCFRIKKNKKTKQRKTGTKLKLLDIQGVGQ